jgi:transposase
MVQEHAADHAAQWAAISSIAGKVGCTAETSRKWVRQAEPDAGDDPGLTGDARARLRALERENRERRRGEPLSAIGPRTMASEILRKARAFFAQAALDRPARK